MCVCVMYSSMFEILLSPFVKLYNEFGISGHMPSYIVYLMYKSFFADDKCISLSRHHNGSEYIFSISILC